MKLTLTLDEVSACAMALLSKAQEAEEEALGCEKLRCASAVEFWKKRAENYRKVYETVAAQFGQACKECELADAEVAKMEEGR